MSNELKFSLDDIYKIVIFAYETGYCDGIEDKFPEMKNYKNAEDYWDNMKDEFIAKFAKK